MLILEDNSNLDIKLNVQEDLPKKISAIDQIIEQLRPKEVPIKNFKVAFIHDEFTTQHGIMILSAVLKQHGFQTDVFITEFIKESIADEIVQFKPDVIACSTMTPGFRSVMDLVGKLKERLPGVFVVMGGSHPTLFPDMFEKEKDLDAICISEGEYPMVELCTSLHEGKLRTDIRNMWIRNGDEIIKNKSRPFIEDIDSLPFPDRDVYFNRYPDLAQRDFKFMTDRGCPFDCSYCFNKQMRDLQEGSFVRYNTAERAIAEIRYVTQNYQVKWVSFTDDTFNANKEKLQNFLTLYKKEIGIPYICRIRIDLTDEDQIRLLKDTGVDRITIGLEHGNYDFRKKYLYRDMANEKIVQFGKWCRDLKIRLHTNNIFGFPDETMELAWDTVNLNMEIKPELASSFLLAPYPGTDIHKYSEKTGHLPENFSFEDLSGHHSWTDTNFKIKSEIQNPKIREMTNLRCFTMILVFIPWIKPLVKILIKLPPNPFYEFLMHMSGNMRVSWPYANWKERLILIRRMIFLFTNWNSDKIPA